MKPKLWSRLSGLHRDFYEVGVRNRTSERVLDAVLGIREPVRAKPQRMRLAKHVGCDLHLISSGCAWLQASSFILSPTLACKLAQRSWLPL